MRDDAKNNIGNYIILDGHGIISGLKQQAYKQTAHKIVAVTENGDIILHSYHRKTRGVLTTGSQDQKYRIISQYDYRGLPKY